VSVVIRFPPSVFLSPVLASGSGPILFLIPIREKKCVAPCSTQSMRTSSHSNTLTPSIHNPIHQCSNPRSPTHPLDRVTSTPPVNRAIYLETALTIGGGWHTPRPLLEFFSFRPVIGNLLFGNPRPLIGSGVPEGAPRPGRGPRHRAPRGPRDRR